MWLYVVHDPNSAHQYTTRTPERSSAVEEPIVGDRIGERAGRGECTFPAFISNVLTSSTFTFPRLSSSNKRKAHSISACNMGVASWGEIADEGLTDAAEEDQTFPSSSSMRFAIINTNSGKSIYIRLESNRHGQDLAQLSLCGLRCEFPEFSPFHAQCADSPFRYDLSRWHPAYPVHAQSGGSSLAGASRTTIPLPQYVHSHPCLRADDQKKGRSAGVSAHGAGKLVRIYASSPHRQCHRLRSFRSDEPHQIH